MQFRHFHSTRGLQQLNHTVLFVCLDQLPVAEKTRGKHPTKPFIQGSEAAECTIGMRNACLFPHCHAASNQAIAESKSGIPPMYLPRQPVVSVKSLVAFSACRCICVPRLSNQSPSISFVSERNVFSQLQLACVYQQPLSAIVYN